MAGYIRTLYGGANAPYALLKHPENNQVANLSTSAWVSYATLNRSVYALAMTREGSSSSYYAQVPNWVSDGFIHFDVEVYGRVGATVAESDPAIAKWVQPAATFKGHVGDAVLDEPTSTHNTAGTYGLLLKAVSSGTLLQADLDAIVAAVYGANVEDLLVEFGDAWLGRHSLGSLVLMSQSFEIDGESIIVTDPGSGDALHTYTITFGSTCPIVGVT